MNKKLSLFAGLLFLCTTLDAIPAYAGKAEAEQAVMEVLFDFDELRSEQYMYTVQPIGWVDLDLDDGVPSELAHKVIKALKAHPDITGVSLTRADFCTN